MYGKLKKGKGYEDKGLVYVPFEKYPLTASLVMYLSDKYLLSSLLIYPSNKM